MARTSSEYDRDWLIRAIAKECDFTIGDVRLIIRTATRLIREAILEGEFVWTGLFSARISTVRAHKGFDAVRQIPIDIEEKKRVTLRPTRTLTNIINGDDWEDC